jgi:hypothetical protein
LSITSKFIEGAEEATNAQAQEGEKAVSKDKDKGRVDWKKVLNVINSNLPNDIRIHCIKIKLSDNFL